MGWIICQRGLRELPSNILINDGDTIDLRLVDTDIIYHYVLYLGIFCSYFSSNSSNSHCWWQQHQKHNRSVQIKPGIVFGGILEQK